MAKKNFPKNITAFAKKHLSSITRRSGESYFDHGCEVAEVLQEVAKDHQLIGVAICHDLLIHPNGQELLRKAPLNKEQRKLVRGMFALRRLHIDERTKDLDVVIRKFTQDGRLVLLRMAHRLNDIRHLNRFEKKLQKHIAQETLHMYTAIAGRLSLHRWRREMEDASFPVLHPRSYRRVENLYKSHKKNDELSLKHTLAFLAKHFKKAGLEANMENRIKGNYSTYRKMVLKSRTFNELTDRLAVRVIVKNREDCYRALGVIHRVMHPIPGKLKDYIGAPKENGYRSIHTVVYPLPGVTEQPLEVQIRTAEMHKECEYGIASHSTYKIWQNILKKPESRVNIFRNLEQLLFEVRSPQQFERALRTYFRSDHIMLFDHLNNLYYLKKPATIMDFACMAYGNRIKRLKSVRLNGKVEQLDTELSDGDVVEIRFGRQNQPKKAWLRKARHKSAQELMKKILTKSP